MYGFEYEEQTNNICIMSQYNPTSAINQQKTKIESLHFLVKSPTGPFGPEKKFQWMDA